MRAYTLVHIGPRPRPPRTPTAQDYGDSPRPSTATSPHDPITPTHAHSSAEDHSPAQGQWWQRWTHNQLWELGKWARAEPSVEGLVHRPCKGSLENCRGAGCHRPHGKPCCLMSSTPRESTPAASPRPRTTRMSSSACRRPYRRHNEKADACGTSAQAQPCTHTPLRHPASVDAPTPAAPTAPREPRAPHSTTRLTPGQQRHHLTPLPSQPRPKTPRRAPSRRNQANWKPMDANTHANRHC